MTARFRRWLAVALAGAAPLWPCAAPGQGAAPIPLLPPAVTTPSVPAGPSRQAPAAPYQTTPVAPYQLAPPTPYHATPATPYQATPPGQSYAAPPTPAPYRVAPPAPYQEAPETPQQQAPIVTTPLARPIPPTAPPSGGPPPASAPTASTPAAPAPTASSPPEAQAPAQATPPPPAEPDTLQPAPPPYPNVWVPERAARLVVLDKIDAQSKDLTVEVGQSASYGALTITVQSCLVRPPDQPADATAFLVISDSHKDEPGFRGWTLANKPWLSLLQNPVYDVWVMGCQS